MAMIDATGLDRVYGMYGEYGAYGSLVLGLSLDCIQVYYEKVTSANDER
jgi:hypothetical protein